MASTAGRRFETGPVSRAGAFATNASRRFSKSPTRPSSRFSASTLSGGWGSGRSPCWTPEKIAAMA
ncbi:MAG: hypothetical protein LW626_12360 [Verrucomicrobium sp.]|nr:hypothetical protein [Verrucomicrobium sp.]